MFRNLRLGLKLVIGFVLVLLVSTAVSVFGIIYMGRIADTTEDMFNHPYTAHTTALSIQSNIIAMSRETKDYVLATDSAARSQSVKRLEELEKQILQEFDALYDSFMGDPALIDDALQAFKDWGPIRQEVIRYTELGQAELAAQTTATRGTPQVQLIESTIQRVVEEAKARAVKFNADARASASSATSSVVGLLILSYIIAALAVFLITRSITLPVSKLLTFTQEIANGNLGVAAVDYDSRDEIGVLTKALNGMQASLLNIVSTVRESVSVVRSSSEQMSAGAEETSASVEELASTANQFASAVDRLSQNNQRISDSAVKVNELSTEGSKEINKTIQTMAEINEEVTVLAAEIGELGRQSEEIGSIVNIITGIANQTNLLALNAAIEAARAGEQGRGFAVVAEEVRQLAEQSAKAAGEITHLIQGIRSSVHTSVQRTEVGASKVKEGMDVVDHTGEMFSEIVRLIEALTEEINSAAAASEELSAGAEEISATTEEQSASAQQMAASVVEVAHAAEIVDQQMNWFKF